MRPALERASLGQVDLFDQTPATKIAVIRDVSGEMPVVMLYCDRVISRPAGGHTLLRTMIDEDMEIAYFSKDFAVMVLDAPLFEPMNRRQRLKLAHEDQQAYQSVGDELDPESAELRKAYMTQVRQGLGGGVQAQPGRTGQYL